MSKLLLGEIENTKIEDKIDAHCCDNAEQKEKNMPGPATKTPSSATRSRCSVGRRLLFFVIKIEIQSNRVLTHHKTQQL